MTSYFRDGNDELQRFVGPNMDEPESPDYVPQLSPEAEKILQSHEFYAIATSEHGSMIHSCEGDELFRVSKTIHYSDLATLIRLYKNRFEDGFERGRIAMQTQLRQLIGAAAIPSDKDSDY